MACDYGCTTEDINRICVECGHPKHRHLQVHPHKCVGPGDKEGVHSVSECNCPGFKLPAVWRAKGETTARVAVVTAENERVERFRPSEDLGTLQVDEESQRDDT